MALTKKPIIKKGSIVEVVNEVSSYAFDITVGKTYKVSERHGNNLKITNNNGDIQTIRLSDVQKPTTKEVHTTGATIRLPAQKIALHEIVGQDHNKKILYIAITKNLPVLLIGQTGVGKTSIIRELATQQKADWIRFNLTGETTVDEFVGKYELEGGQTVWRDGILLQAMKRGQWIIVDEINTALPEILFVLHSLLDDDKFVVVASHASEIVRPHENFRFFATMNPTDEYAGTKELNKAFQSRFNVVLTLDYPNNKTEARIVQDKTGVDGATASKIADVAVALRKAKEEEKIFYTCSTRDLLQWCNLVENLGLEDAFMVSVLNKANSDQKPVVDIYDKIVGRHLKLASKGYTLSIDWFEAAAQELEEQKASFEKDKLQYKQKITEDIINKLSADGSEQQPTAVADSGINDDARTAIGKILKHELYAHRLIGTERSDGIIESLVELELISPESAKGLYGSDHRLNTVEDVEQLLISAKREETTAKTVEPQLAKYEYPF